MKKLFVVLLSLLLALQLTACGGQDASAPDTPPADGSAVVAPNPSTSVPEETPMPDRPTDPAPLPEDAEDGNPTPDGSQSADEPQSPLAHEESSQPQDIPEEESSQPQNAPEEETMKVLVAYFSLVDIIPDGADAVTHATPSQGNTQTAALEIQTQTGGDLFQITTEQEYPVLHREASAIAEDEMRSDARPALTSQVENMEQYDVIFVGYPIWWYTSPMAIRTFLEAYDFSGKTIVPFCTTMGAGVDQSVGEIRNLCPDATVLDGLTLSTGRADAMPDRISEWIDGLELELD